MPTPKVFYQGSNPALLHALRLKGDQPNLVEQISESFPVNDLAQLPDLGLLVLQYEPRINERFASLLQWQTVFPQIPVVVITSDYTPDTTKFLMRQGAKDVLPMPINDAQLLDCYTAYLPGFELSEPQVRSYKMPTPADMGSKWQTPAFIQRGLTEVQAPMILKINYFGLLEVYINNVRIEFNWQAKMLFGYLAFHAGKALSREHLARVFWPEKQESQPESARRSLNVELNHIRKAIKAQTGLDHDLIQFDKNCYRLNHPGAIQSDLALFKSLVYKIQTLQRNNLPVSDEDFHQAIRVYSSNFLDDCPEDALNWVQVERQHLSALFEQLAEQYSTQLCDKCEYYRAAAVCHEILSRDQGMEVIHRRLMVCYGKLGMCHKVEQQYRLLCQIMERNFGTKPSPDTTRLYLKLKKDCDSVV